jgi:hypothetical protein
VVRWVPWVPGGCLVVWEGDNPPGDVTVNELAVDIAHRPRGVENDVWRWAVGEGRHPRQPHAVVFELLPRVLCEGDEPVPVAPVCVQLAGPG